MKVYIAASSQELDRVRDVARRLEAAGVEVAGAWWEIVATMRWHGKTDADLLPHEQAQHARADLDAIESADVLLFLAPTTPTRGAWVELGYALAQGVRVIVSGDTGSIFGTRARATCDSDDAAVAWLAGEVGQ